MKELSEEERKRRFQNYVNSDPLNSEVLLAAIGKPYQVNGASVREVAFNLDISIATAAARMNGLLEAANLPTASYPTGQHLRHQMIEWGVVKISKKS